MVNPLKAIQKQMNKNKKGFMEDDKRAKKVGLIPGVDSPYQWLPVGDVEGTNKEAF